MKGRPWPASAVASLAALWMAAAGNLPLWQRLAELDPLNPAQRALLMGVMLGVLWSALMLLLSLFTWRLWLKPVLTLLLLVCAAASHFMASYGVVIDASMMTNVLQTDRQEAAALLDWRLPATLGWLAGVPLLWLWRQDVSYGSAARRLWRNLLLALGSAALLGAVVLAAFQPLASLMRNHKDLRYLLNPLASVYALVQAAQPPGHAAGKLQPLGEDATLAPLPRPRILLLVVGETARSANFWLNGYGRPTTPELQREDVASFRNAWSCGTSTAVSLPCMFSGRTRAQFDRAAPPRENLLDVLQRAGLAVLWLDNQSGCKGVCDRVPHARTGDGRASGFCLGDECLDEALLDGLDQRLAALDAQRRARGVVLVMHQMGSHGPAYYKRSPAATKRFLPECLSHALQDCSAEALVNAYDNSIAYTDHVLARSIAWLSRQQAAFDPMLLYVSDHGESLGENHMYLHGVPYALAPREQTHVPMLLWLPPQSQAGVGVTRDCLLRQRDAPLSHDHLFHTVATWLGVGSQLVKPALDLAAPCRSA